MADAFPRSFGRYTLIANLAQGGMGALYLACQGEHGMEKLCVIKTVLPGLADKEYVARFRDEAKVVVKLSHGNLVPVFDAGMAGGLGGVEMYLAMDYVDGKDLRAVWNRCAKKGIAFPVDVAVFIAANLCRGLHHAHSVSQLKLVHRDVSPPNILLSFFGEVKLTDFGLASSTLKTEKTAPGVVYGKVSYMSPEQARGETLDGRTDLYAVGIILWELLTGRQLFPQAEHKLIERVRDPSVDPPSTYAPRVPPALDAIVMKALAKDKTLRFADCEAFRAALGSFLAQTAPTTDSSRVSAFLHQLFEGEIEEDRVIRQRMLEDASKWAAEHAAKPKQPVGDPKQNVSQPETVSLQPRPSKHDDKKSEAAKHSEGIVGSYIDSKYLIRRLIGEGGMGLVYEAEHVEIGRRVAVKVLHAMYTRQAEVVSRFRSEARAATRIGHPHIIDVFDSGTTVEGAVYFVMEFLEGRDLSQLVEEDGPLPAQRSIAIAREICQALMAAHKAGILHRDLKPENVFLIDRDGKRDFVKVLDFGIAKTMEAVTDRVGRLTNPGVAMGTPEYMAPEQAAGLQIDARADVYAVGAILYEMLSGRPPHEGAHIMEVLTRKATIAPTPLSVLRPDVPRDLESLVMRTLAISPELRPQSMLSMSQELGKLSGATPTEEQPIAITDRVPRNKTPYVAAAVVASAAVIGITWFAIDRMSSPPNGKTNQPIAGAALSTTTAIQPAIPPATAPTLFPPTSISRSEPPTPNPQPPTNVITVDKPVVLKPAPASDAKATAPMAPPNPALALAEARRMLGKAHEAEVDERYAEAEDLYNRVRATGLERGSALTGLAEVAFQRGQYPEAVRAAHRAVESGGGVAAKMVLGNSYFKLGKYDEAILEYREVLQADAGHREARANLAAAEKRRGG
ncbi:MAG TPA: protein kinase [Polyangia bacterium]